MTAQPATSRPAAHIARRTTTLWQVVLIVAATVAVHHRIYTIPFTYSEIAGIERNRVVTSPTEFFARMMTPKGLLHRPISVFSYTLNYAVHGKDVAGFHLVNLVIHCANAVLVYLLARDFFAAPLVGGLVFGLHPLATACVGQIFGRNYSLATTFFLIALYCYLRWRRRGPLSAAQLAVMILLFGLAVLTKQTLVVLPLVVAWHEIRIRNVGLRRLGDLLGSSWRTAFVAAFAVVLGLELAALYAVPLSKTAAIPPLAFLLSQIANAPVIAGFFLLPYQTAFIHELYVYDSVAHVEVWIGFALVIAIVVIAYRWRTQPIPWLIGALVLCLLPTNSVLPKNEIVREWRLYPSLPFYALLVGAVYALTHRWLSARAASPMLRAALPAALALYLASYAHTDVLQNRAYQTELDAWRSVLARYPYSADAMNNIGLEYYRARDFAQAVVYFERATLAAPDVWLYRQNLAHAYSAGGEHELAQQHWAAAKELRTKFGPRRMIVHYR